jgi:hypothetical protein
MQRLKRYERETASPRERRGSGRKEREKSLVKEVEGKKEEVDKGFHSGSEEGEIEED